MGDKMEDVKIDYGKVELMKWVTKKANGRLIEPSYNWLPKMPSIKKGKIKFLHEVNKVNEIPTDADCEVYVSSKELKFYDYFELFEDDMDREYSIYNVGEWLVLEVSVKKGKVPDKE